MVGGRVSGGGGLQAAGSYECAHGLWWHPNTSDNMCPARSAATGQSGRERPNRLTRGARGRGGAEGICP